MKEQGKGDGTRTLGQRGWCVRVPVAVGTRWAPGGRGLAVMALSSRVSVWSRALDTSAPWTQRAAHGLVGRGVRLLG